MYKKNTFSYKIIISFIIILIIPFSLNAWRYDGKKDIQFYTIDLTDQSNWEVVDDSQDYDSLFQNANHDAFIEVAVYDLNNADSNEDLLTSFVDRLEMDGEYDKTKFCRYNALRGKYSFYFNNTDLIMDIVVFKDKYFYYVVMGYAHDKKYNNYKSELEKIMSSFKIYYDDGVIYGNDKVEDTNNKQTKNTNEDNPKNKNNDNSNKEKGESYTVHIKWEKQNENFKFFKEDLDKAKKELNDIGNYTGGSWNGWKYYKIDTNEDDYEFTFWSKFYQDMFQKNYYRVNDVYNYFKNNSKDMSSFDLANSVMKCIQVIPYERPKDIEGEKNGSGILDFFTPNQIAFYDKGDCDTKSMFMVILLRRLGYDALILYSRDYGHAMVGLNINASGKYKTYNGKKYYFVESTYPGWKIGDVPQGMDDLNKWRVVPIK